MTTVIEERPNEKVAKKPAMAAHAPAPQRDLSDARRFAGQPVVMWFRLQKSMEEILFFRASGRHHSAAEVSEPRSHARWRKESVALLRSLADAIVEGQLEPEQPKKPEPELEDVDGIEW
jgi:hypothetical protein